MKTRTTMNNTDARHKLALFEGLTGFAAISAQAIGDMADGIQRDNTRETVKALEELAAEAETLRRIALDAIQAGAKCK